MTVGEVVHACLEELPAHERAALAEVRVIVAPQPRDVDLERGCKPDQRACFWGVPRSLEPGPGGGPLPDAHERATGEVVLFLRNLAPLTRSRVRIAVLHEFAHALGFDEDAVTAMGLQLETQGGAACTSR